MRGALRAVMLRYAAELLIAAAVALIIGWLAETGAGDDGRAESG